jgi:hypothetical protein
LIPDAKNPPKGAMSEAKVARMSTWNWMGATVHVVGRPYAAEKESGMKGML